MLDKVYNFANFFDNDERDFVKNSFQNHGQWQLEGISNTYTGPYRSFWIKDLIDHKGLIMIFKNKIEIFLNKGIEVNTFYARGQAHGQCGLFHSDVEQYKQGEYATLIYFIHDDWLPEYGGHLMIKEESEIISLLPDSNSAVLFDSKKFYCSLEPTT